MLRSLSIKAACLCALFTFNTASAYDLSDLFNKENIENVVNGFAATNNIEVKDLAGTWAYKAPAIVLESKDVIKKAGGAAMATTIENKLAPYYFKFGAKNATISFEEDGKFNIKSAKGNLTGTVTKSDSTFTFNFNKFSKNKGLKIEALIKKSATLEITFDISKIVPLITKIANATDKKSLKSISDLLNSYDGIYAGVELKKQ